MFPDVAFPSWPTLSAREDAAAIVLAQLCDWVTSTPLLALARDWGGSPPVDSVPATVFEWYEDFSAKHWDFRRGVERNLTTAATLTPEREQLVLDVARALGMVDARSPERDSYDYCLVLGGLLRACLVRPRHAAALIAGGVSIGEVVALGGFRRLAGDEVELASDLAVHASDEFDAMAEGVRRAFSPSSQATLEGTASRSNSDWRVARYVEENVSVIAAPSTEPEVRRANSVDTYNWWADRNAPLAMKQILLITNPIYVPYQGAGAIQVFGLHHGASVETIGVSTESADIGEHTQVFSPSNYLQEIRSAIRGYFSLFKQLAGLR